MKNLFLLSIIIIISVASQAQRVGINNDGSAPDNSAMLDVKNPNKGLLIPRVALTGINDAATIPSPATSLLIYNTATTTGGNAVAPGFYYWNGSLWAMLSTGSAGDNLGNHTATQTFNLNSQRLQGNAVTALGDSTAQVELTAYVVNPSTAISIRSNAGSNRFTRTLLSGYGIGPFNSLVDYGIWAHAYRAGGWGIFASAGPDPNHPVRWVGLAQNPANGGSAIRIVDGTEGTGKVLTSDNVGYGTWQTALGDNLGNHIATEPLKYATDDADKIYFTYASGTNGSKIAHSSGWLLDYYAGPNNSNAGTHRFFTGTTTGWNERMRITPDGYVGIGTSQPSTSLEVNGFTKLGSNAPAIKTLELTGTIPAAAGQAFVAHGLDDTKIMSVTAMVNTGVNQIPPNFTLTNVLYGVYIYNGQVVLQTSNSASSGSVYNKPVRILIMYKE